MLTKRTDPTDHRKIAIYARKSKLTETGKSIENQITKCKSYAELKFDAAGDDILVYQDEGLSGFYSDRPQYVHMLQDIKANKIKAVICYKFDRISRRTLDLLNLVEQLRQKKIDFISCTDEVDTSSKTGKIIMSLLASIAEFERDIIAERISDNMYELAKEGRWLGGTTPTGFYSKKEYVVSGGKKTSVNHLEPVEAEQAIVREMFRRFLKEQSIQRVVDWAAENRVLTKNDRRHTRTSVKDILSNPVYAVADADTYAYFKAFDVPIYAVQEDFDGERGLMVYNKTAQVKEVRGDSSAINPTYVKRTADREVDDWIVSVGKHKGLVQGKDWIAAQRSMRDNRDKFNRPNDKTHSLLSGLIVCPFCGKNLFTQRETGRFTDGEPRYLYKCQTKRKDSNACRCKDIKGNVIDKFIINAICAMADEGSEYYFKLLASDALQQEKLIGLDDRIRALERQIDKNQSDIESQTRSLRMVSEISRGFILEDIDKLAGTLRQMEDELDALRSEKRGRNLKIDTLSKTRALIFSFPALIENLSYQEKSDLIRKIVERIFVLSNGAGDDEVHIFVKGTPDEEYSDFFQTGCERGDLCKRGNYSICYVSDLAPDEPGRHR